MYENLIGSLLFCIIWRDNFKTLKDEKEKSYFIDSKKYLNMNYILGAGVIAQRLGEYTAPPKDPSLVSMSGCSQMPRIAVPRDLAHSLAIEKTHVDSADTDTDTRTYTWIKIIKLKYILWKSYQLKGTESYSSLVLLC